MTVSSSGTNTLPVVIGNRTGEWREGFAFASTHNSLNQITNRSWSGTLTVSGYVTNRLNPGKRGVDVGVQTECGAGSGLVT